MANERIHLLHYKTANESATPASSDMLYGEIAMRYAANQEKLFVKNANNNIVEISADHFIHDRIDEQDEKLSEAVGLSATTLSERQTYHYIPSNELLNECSTMNDSVETLATKLNECLTQIETLKSNQYFIDTNFNVQTDTNYSSETITYTTKTNNNITIPKSVVITKAVNDGVARTILSNEGVATDTITSTIEGAKERYTILVTPDLDGALQTKVEKTRYMCYIGRNNSQSISSTEMLNFGKKISEGTEVTYSVETFDNDYIWICVPASLNVALVTSEGLPVTLSDDKIAITTDLGIFTCHRTFNRLSANTWKLVIKHVL